MTQSRLLAIVAIVAILVAIGALIVLRRGGPADQTAPDPVALVTTVAARSQTVQDVVSLYGVIQADPAGVTTIAAPRGVVVAQVLVRPGQAVTAGQALITVANAPATRMAYQQAAEAAASADADLARVQRLYEDRLAANDQLIAAKKAADDARSALAAQQSQGAGQGSQTITAPQAAVVTAVSAATGDRVAQDAPLLVLAKSRAATAKLGVEASLGRIAPGQVVTLRTATGQTVVSRIAMVGSAADPASRTLDAIVSLNGAAAPIGSAVQGDVVIGSHPGVTVPRAAVVFDETGTHLFTISGGKAHRVFVKVGLDHGDSIEAIGVPPGAAVAVEGAYELQDGMAVKARAQ